MIYTRAKPRPRLSNRLHFQLKIIFRKPPIWQYSAERTTIYSKNYPSKNKRYDWLNWKKRRSVILFSTIMNNLNALKIISRFNLNTIPFPWRGRKSKYLRSTLWTNAYIYIYISTIRVTRGCLINLNPVPCPINFQRDGTRRFCGNIYYSLSRGPLSRITRVISPWQ